MGLKRRTHPSTQTPYTTSGRVNTMPGPGRPSPFSYVLPPSDPSWWDIGFIATPNQIELGDGPGVHHADGAGPRARWYLHVIMGYRYSWYLWWAHANGSRGGWHQHVIKGCLRGCLWWTHRGHSGTLWVILHLSVAMVSSRLTYSFSFPLTQCRWYSRCFSLSIFKI